MTTEELHDILDDEKRKITIDELKEIIYELKRDTLYEYNKELNKENLHISQFYCGETNALTICMDLIEHLKVE